MTNVRAVGQQAGVAQLRNMEQGVYYERERWKSFRLVVVVAAWYESAFVLSETREVVTTHRWELVWNDCGCSR
jgi:hypothetical protein